nr:hypothetical protein Iba_chr05cCG17890 [Ipomoea batatas]
MSRQPHILGPDLGNRSMDDLQSVKDTVAVVEGVLDDMAVESKILTWFNWKPKDSHQAEEARSPPWQHCWRSSSRLYTPSTKHAATELRTTEILPPTPLLLSAQHYCYLLHSTTEILPPF